MPKIKPFKADASLFLTTMETAVKSPTSSKKSAQKTRNAEKNSNRKELVAEHAQKLDKLRRLAQSAAQPSAEQTAVKKPHCLKETYRKILEKLEFRYTQKPTFNTLQELLEVLKPAITGDEMQKYIEIDPKIPPVLIWAPLKNKWIAGDTLCDIIRNYMQWNETKYPDKKIITQVKKSNTLQMEMLQIENEEPFYRFLINNQLY